MGKGAQLSASPRGQNRVRAVPTRQEESHLVRLSKDGSTYFVSDLEGTFSAIDRKSGKLLKSVTTGENTEGFEEHADELRALYEQEQGLKPSDNVVAYCRIGERSSHTWFVLKYLLGYGNVRNYDGSWTEWGNLVGAPIER